MARLMGGLAKNSNTFIYDSLFCEWGYILNLDSEELEIYEGFQESEPVHGRYKKSDHPEFCCDKYYPCELVLTVPLLVIAVGNGRCV